MQIEPDEIRSTFDVNLRDKAKLQETLLVEQRKPSQDVVVSRARLLQPCFKFALNIRQPPAAEVAVQVICDRMQLILGDVLVDRDKPVPNHPVTRRNDHQNSVIGE